MEDVTATKKKISKLSGPFFVFALVFFAIAYFFFHHITKDGFTKEKQMKAGKPFVTDMIGLFGTECLFASVGSLIIGKIMNK